MKINDCFQKAKELIDTGENVSILFLTDTIPFRNELYSEFIRLVSFDSATTNQQSKILRTLGSTVRFMTFDQNFRGLKFDYVFHTRFPNKDVFCISLFTKYYYEIDG